MWPQVFSSRRREATGSEGPSLASLFLQGSPIGEGEKEDGVPSVSQSA